MTLATRINRSAESLAQTAYQKYGRSIQWRRPARRSVRLTTKRARKGYYKGVGVGSRGFFCKRKGAGDDHSVYRIDRRKCLDFIPPAGWLTALKSGDPNPTAISHPVTGFRLTPFVPKLYKPLYRGIGPLGSTSDKSPYAHYQSTGGPLSGHYYLDRWKWLNGKS